MPNKSSRTKNSVYNFVTSIGAQLITIVMSFITRTIFINTLGKNYLGISSLFSNILSMLSLAELGVGTAILYKLYQPLAEDNHPRICSLISFYKQIYRIIAVIITCLGLLLIPALPYLISDYDSLEQLGLNATLIFLLYLFNTVSSYMFFAYRSAIIKADQKEYILNVVSYAVIIVQNVLQILSLIFVRDFILYITIQIFMVIVQNIIYAIISNKYYPFIRESKPEKITKQEVKSIIKDCYALLLYRINGVVLKSTDNIILSAFMGLEIVAMYSNYYVFYTTINSLFSRIFSSFVHSVGNLHATKQTEKEYTVFKTSVLVASLLGGTACVGIFVVADDFIKTWVGSEWIIPQPFAFLMGLELFTLSLRTLLSRYRNAYGLFQEAKYRPVFSVIVNLAVSIVLVQYWGICGVLVGTIIADWTTFMTFDPVILHKYGFAGKYSTKIFYGQIALNLATTLVMGGIWKIICMNLLSGHGWITVILEVGFCGLFTPLALFAVNFRKSETKFLLDHIKSLIKR